MVLKTKLTPLGNGIRINKTPIRFDYTGNFQEYIVPTGVKKIIVDCVAAKGFGTTGGGGRVECVLSVKPKQILYIYVGGTPSAREIPSYNASDIRSSAENITDNTSLAHRLIVAGGAGSQGSRGPIGGSGGGLTVVMAIVVILVDLAEHKKPEAVAV